MNADRLLEHFERISDAADAVPRLRRFVLDLAVRGRLVPQDSRDEPVAALLTAIAATKAKQTTNSGTKAAVRSISQLAEADAPWPAPSAWAWCRFGDVVISRDSERVPVSKEERSALAKTYDYYGASGVIDKIDRFLFDKPLLLIGEDGANLVNRSSPIAFMARGKYWVNNHAHVLDGVSEDMLRFLELHINAIDLKPFITGTAQPKMNQAKMNSVPVVIPPLAEQRRIVAKVDELMALCDRLEAAQTEREARRNRLVSASLARATEAEGADAISVTARTRFHLDHFARLTTRPEHVKQLRQTILNLAVRGRLVPQDPKDESVAHFLRRLAEARDVSRKTKTLEHAASGASESPYQVPRGWVWTAFGSLINDSDSGWSPKTEGFPRIGNNWGVLKVSAVSWDTFLPDENKQLLPGVSPPDRAVVHSGDFLISRANTSELIAKCVVVEQCPARLIMSDKIVRLAIVEGISKRYLFVVNNYAEFARMHYAANATGTSLSMKNVSRDVIYNLPIPLPPIAEQYRIVEKVDELLALCNQLEASLASAATDRARLLEALLHEALAPAA